ncbi:MAG: translocation/assembly module TamB domain-containing protein [Candidatus Omnitrophota bacterium]|nr:translocation/assembly module TamB [Candidatus Omnitrophota bacterium]
MGKKPKKKILSFSVGALIVCFVGVYFFLFTTPGGSFVIRWVVPKFIKAEKIEFQTAQGSILKKLTMKNIRIHGLNGLSRESILKINQVDLWLTNKINPVIIKFSNGRLSLPTSELVLFRGDYRGGSLNFNIYSNRIGIDSLAFLFGQQKALSSLKGNLTGIDLFLTGYTHELVLRGNALVEELNQKSFSLTGAPFVCDLILKKDSENVRVNGTVIIKKGKISGPGTVFVQLDESKLFFSGDYNKPGFNIKGNSMVETVKIRIVLKGTFDKPELKLSSEPPLSQEQLMVMLATGRKWDTINTMFSSGAIPSDLALDFIDYFVLGGTGSKIAGKFGITGLSVTFDNEKKGVGVKKSVYDKVEVGYGVIQAQNKEKAQTITQKVSGELKVTDTVSVGAEKEFTQSSALGGSPEEQETNDKVMIKFKKSF